MYVLCSLTLKSIPTVDIKLPDKKVPSRNRTSKHVLPTPESPSSITCWIWDGWTPVYSSHTKHRYIHEFSIVVIIMILCALRRTVPIRAACHSTPCHATPRRPMHICVLCVPISFFPPSIRFRRILVHFLRIFCVHFSIVHCFWIVWQPIHFPIQHIDFQFYWYVQMHRSG